jgi:hypothetical protein
VWNTGVKTSYTSVVIGNGFSDISEIRIANLSDWTEHFGIYVRRKPTNASKLSLYGDV